MPPLRLAIHSTRSKRPMTLWETVVALGKDAAGTQAVNREPGRCAACDSGSRSGSGSGGSAAKMAMAMAMRRQEGTDRRHT